ncbi:MAG: hypothetical protein HQK83_11195, partial [Fibrobacteria bacterium]|nr:hypothetical protein [Fibrobacteria bacterium]
MNNVYELLDTSDAIDKNIQEVPLFGASFKKEGHNLYLQGLGRLSTRACNNLAHWTGVPAEFIDNLTQDTLNAVVREQLDRKGQNRFRVGLHPYGKEEIIFLQPMETPYLPYTKVLGPFSDKIETVIGDPVTHDRLIAFQKIQDLDIPGENLKLGQKLKVSSTNIKPLTSEIMTLRMICTNGMVEKEHANKYTFNTRKASAD